jgi:hypothetical protein
MGSPLSYGVRFGGPRITPEALSMVDRLLFEERLPL